LVSNRWNGKWLIAYLDDASRFIVGYGVFDEATTENAISYWKEALIDTANYLNYLQSMVVNSTQILAKLVSRNKRASAASGR
jgi:hypothetical protein